MRTPRGAIARPVGINADRTLNRMTLTQDASPTSLAVIPAKAGIHFDLCGMSWGDQAGSQLSLG
jgi:hypothetical protein